MNRHTKIRTSKLIRRTRRQRFGGWQPHVGRLYGVPRFPEAADLATRIVDSGAALTPAARRRAIVRVALVLIVRFLEHGQRWKRALAEPGDKPGRGRPRGAAWVAAESCFACGVPIEHETLIDWSARQRRGGWAALMRDGRGRGRARRMSAADLAALRRHARAGISVARAWRELGLACSLRTAQLVVAGDAFDPKRNPHLAVGCGGLN